MAQISQTKVADHFTRAQSAATMKEKGEIFEDLICYLMEKVPGISVAKRNVLNPYHSEEIDIALWNDKHRSGLHFLSNLLLIEAKNWSVAVGSVEMTHFISKLEERGLDFGLFVALNGITGQAHDITAARDKIRLALGKQIRVVVMKKTDIETFSRGEDVVRFIKEKLCELAASGTQFS